MGHKNRVTSRIPIVNEDKGKAIILQVYSAKGYVWVFMQTD